MAEPKSDHRTIDACLQQPHGHRMSEHVRSDALFAERRAGFAGDGDVFGQQVRDTIRAEATAMAGGEEYFSAAPGRFPQP